MRKKETRMQLKIPKESMINDFIDRTSKIPLYKQIEKYIIAAEANKKQYSIQIYDEFVMRISIFYPEKRLTFDKLRPYIFRHILNGEVLNKDYYEEMLPFTSLHPPSCLSLMAEKDALEIGKIAGLGTQKLKEIQEEKEIKLC